MVGCGAVLYLDDDVAEIKRMWVSPDVRGLGIGKRLLRRLEDVARFAGRRTVLLHMNASLIEAIAMYEAAGYRRVDRYNDNPYAQLWFSRSLDER